MLTRVDVNSENAFYLPILGATTKDSLLVRKITGLNVPDLDLFIGDYSRDGGYYAGRRVKNRNVVITMELNPNPALGETMMGLRELLYKAFMDPLIDADYLQLGLHLDDSRILYVVGYTEKIDTDMFDVENLAQISIVCPDPYIRDTAPTVLTHPTGWTQVPFAYHGTAETGFETEVYITATTATLTLDNNSITNDSSLASYQRGRMRITPTAQLANGDVVYINTVPGSHQILKAPASAITSPMAAMDVTDRWAALLAAGVTTPLIGALSPLSDWLQLHTQANTMKVYGANSSILPAAVRTLKYTQAYWGI